ncbi:MAG: S8 family serine peptidase [Kiritimatiellae bacterium]|nr:S8 family serine peptidase [Kiritimatiellia bacterium]MDD4341376.1 S8 family serine peptidase [Kiritimatiellia bacterium]
MRVSRLTGIVAVWVGLVCIAPPPAQALYFRLDGDRLWLQAEKTPLVEVLRPFSHAGVTVRMDPAIQATVQATFRGVRLDEGLSELLGSYDYLVTWKMLRGPLGRVPKLQEIEIFHPGNRTTARPLFTPKRSFDTTRGVAGNRPEFIRDELLIGVRPGTTYAQFQHLLDQVGGMIVDVDPATGVYQIRFPPGTHVEELLERLARHPLVAHAELNQATRLPVHSIPPVPSRSIPPVSPPADGAIPVAVLDTGLNPAIGIDSLVTAGWDAVNPDRTLSDSNGHGTQMALLAAGVLAAEGFSSDGRMLPLVSVRAFDDEGVTSNFALLQALTYAAQAGAKVVNLSWGSETDSDFLRAAVENAAAQGMIVVAAAGNAPTGQPVYPAAYPSVLAVGGSRANGHPWTQSNFGDFVDVAAPAAAILPGGAEGVTGAYAGTSISSATVSHALGQYINQHPTASMTDVLAALRAALSPSVGAGYGAGLLDEAALQRFLSQGASP